MTNSTSLDPAVAGAAQQLRTAWAERTPCPSLRTALPAGDIMTAYAVQRVNIAGRLAAGRRVVGRKIGLTNPVVQAQLGVDQPDFGFLLDDMQAVPGEVIDIGRTLQPRIEAEVAFILGADLDQPVIDNDTVRTATAAIAAALEIVDSRIQDWDISIIDTVADNASAGLFVVSDESRPLGDLDLRPCSMTLHRGGDLVSSGKGADCLGDPVTAMVWLARTAQELGDPLRAGDIVLSGALGPVIPVKPGDMFSATVSEVGTVTAYFGAKAGGRA